MKKRLFLILSVILMLAVGCGNKNNILTDIETETSETASRTVESDITDDEETSVMDWTDNEDTEEEQTERETPKDTEPEERDKTTEETPAPLSVSQPEQKKETEHTQSSTDMAKPEETKAEETKPEETKLEEIKPQEPIVTEYNPVSVCSQAVAKCQAGGMITTTDNLGNLLAEGKITLEEYDSYYPYDGLGYYSVFVETDLNEASTTSGRKLGSEDGIADYIAGMLLLETEPVFYIEYAGVYNLNGTDFYEFRCYR
ncbi:MAG: hypothetical protein NC548_61945 [Lachnospiraceae bacterium]|nr:hypothetical protein [Lachnospiraceae bacterium]MCM1375565.1 hypothetical protein [Muribaculum sp.]